MILGVAAAGAWMLFVRPPPAPSPAPTGVAPAQAPAALSYHQLVALADRVKALQAQRRYAEALPGGRMLLEQHGMRGRLASSMLVDYGRMLNNAAFEAGAGAPRSSFERIALERQALETAQIALAQSVTPRERAEAITLVGLVHEAWGFPYDAYLTYRAALGTDPTYPVARQHYDQFLNRLGPVSVPGKR